MKKMKILQTLEGGSGGNDGKYTEEENTKPKSRTKREEKKGELTRLGVSATNREETHLLWMKAELSKSQRRLSSY